MLVLPFRASSQTSITQAEAIFLFNFTKMVEWPLEYQHNEFVVGVCGNQEAFETIHKYFQGKNVGSQPVKVIFYQFAENVGKCHMLFVSFGKSNDLTTIKGRVGSNKTLIVSERTGALKEGAVINFVVLEDKLKFELNTQNASKYGLKILSELKNMATKNN